MAATFSNGRDKINIDLGVILQYLRYTLRYLFVINISMHQVGDALHLSGSFYEFNACLAHRCTVTTTLLMLLSGMRKGRKNEYLRVTLVPV